MSDGRATGGQHALTSSSADPAGTPEGRTVRVLLVDDDHMVLQGLELMLGAHPRIRVVSAVGSGEEAPAATLAHRPDVVLMDVRMHARDGIETTAVVKALPNPPKVLILTTFDFQDITVGAVRSGADGVLLKTTSPTDLTTAILEVAAGRSYYSPAPASHLTDVVRDDSRSARADGAARALQLLSPRERDTLVLLALGGTNDGIARRLHVSVGTVKSHISAAQAKLGVSSRTELAVLAERGGLLDQET